MSYNMGDRCDSDASEKYSANCVLAWCSGLSQRSFRVLRYKLKEATSGDVKSPVLPVSKVCQRVEKEHLSIFTQGQQIVQ